MTPSDKDGPSLETYIETRFNLLTEAVKHSADAQTSALNSAIESVKQTFSAADLRYQQRFDAQADALAAAFSAAKEAVNAALAGADRAVLKAELAADKRFEALNELREMLNDTLKILMTRTEVTALVGAAVEKIDAMNKRVDVIEARFNTLSGESAGGRRSRDDTRLWIGVAITVILAGLAIATFVIARMRVGG